MWATSSYTSCEDEVLREDGQKEIGNENGNILYDTVVISTGYKPKEDVV